MVAASRGEPGLIVSSHGMWKSCPRPWAPCFTNNAPDSDRDQPDQFDKYPLTRKRGILFSPPSLFSSLVLLKLLQCVNCPWYALAVVCGKVSCRYGLLVYNEPHIFNPVTDEHGILVSIRTLIFHLICIYIYTLRALTAQNCLCLVG